MSGSDEWRSDEWQHAKSRGGSMPKAGLHHVKTACKVKLRCKPKVKGEEYLRLYLAQKEEERLVRYREVLGYSVETTETGLADVATEIGKLKDEVATDMGLEAPASAERSPRQSGRETPRPKPLKPFTKVTLDY